MVSAPNSPSFKIQVKLDIQKHNSQVREKYGLFKNKQVFMCDAEFNNNMQRFTDTGFQAMLGPGSLHMEASG